MKGHGLCWLCHKFSKVLFLNKPEKDLPEGTYEYGAHEYLFDIEVPLF